MEIPTKVTNIMQKLLDNDHDAYIIGGAVRDTVLMDTPRDYDIFTDATGEEILKIFPGGKIIGNADRQAKILTVIIKGTEVSSYRTNGDRTETGISFEEHLETCDFSINAMAMDINGYITDNHFGIMDIAMKSIDCVGNAKTRINEDKLRVFRAIRFSLRFNFDIEDDLADVIRTTDISDIPVERIREEILKIITYPDGLHQLEVFGLLEKVIPEFTPCCTLSGGKHHNEYVNDHMSNAQDISCGLTDNPVLVFACALHDIGKGESFQLKDDGNISFHLHEKAGAVIIRDIMARMKFSNTDIKYAQILVAEHMFRDQSDMKDKTAIKHFKNLEDAGITIEDHMIMTYCDHQANMKTSRIKFGDYIKNNTINQKYYKLKFSGVPFRVADLEINGCDLTRIGIPEGAEIGRMLNTLFSYVINGEVKNERHSLIYFAKKLFVYEDYYLRHYVIEKMIP